MLPFLAPRKQAGVIMAKRTPEEKTEVVSEEGEHPPGLMAAAEDLISAVHAKDAKGVADALKAGVECCDYDEPMESFEADEV
jgi:hypothetical protein